MGKREDFVNRLRALADKLDQQGFIVGPAEGKKNYVDCWPVLSHEDFQAPKNDHHWRSATGLSLIVGAPSNTICLDIDILMSINPELIARITEKLPPILCGKTGNPDKRPAQFFRFNGEVGRKFNNIHVEILATGGQTIIPPSKHPDFDKEYEWVGTPLTDLTPDDLPCLPDGFIDFLESLNDEFKPNGVKKDVMLAAAPGRCKHGSHNKLSALAVALFHSAYPFDRLTKRLISEDRKINKDEDFFYFNCPTRPWKTKSIEKNAEDFVEEIFKKYGPGGTKAISKVYENSLENNGYEIFRIPPIEIFYTTDKDGREKTRPPSQSEVAQHIVEHFGDNVAKFEKDVFTYTGTHWQQWIDADFDRLCATITNLFFNETGLSRVEAIMKYTFKKIRSFSSTPYEPNPYISNFQDGVLEAVEENGQYKLIFREHRKEDMALSVIPTKYNTDRSIKNEMFEKMISEVTGGDSEKIRVLKQMYGAVILPIFPHLFMMVGQGGTGKSSVIKCSIFLRDQNSISHADPTGWGENFGLEPMIGKLVNIDLDIETHKAIADSLVKKIEDRYTFNVNRKNKPAIKAPIPALHIFGANKLPPTLEWGSKAHDRRWTFITFDKFDGSNNSDREFARRAYQSCPEGVLNFALDGLNDLIRSKGKYHQTEESKEAVKLWQLKNDSIGQFVNELRESSADNVGLKVSTMTGSLIIKDESKILKKDVWVWFTNWHQDAFNRKPSVGKNSFFDALACFNMKSCKIMGYHYFKNIDWSDKINPK